MSEVERIGPQALPVLQEQVEAILSEARRQGASACEVTVDAGQQSHRHSGDVADLAASLRSLAQEFWQTRR